MGADGARALRLDLSTIIFEMLFNESYISCAAEHFFFGFLQIGLKMWTVVAKPFPLFTTDPALDDDGPLTSIASTFTLGSHWGSTNSTRSSESPDPSAVSVGIGPLVQNDLFLVATVPQNMMSRSSRFGKPSVLNVFASGHACMWTTSS